MCNNAKSEGYHKTYEGVLLKDCLLFWNILIVQYCIYHLLVAASYYFTSL